MVVSSNVDLNKPNSQAMDIAPGANPQVCASGDYGDVAVETNPDVGWFDQFVVDGCRVDVLDH